MGHNAGWLALSSGLAAGADIILIPEIEYDIEKVFDELLRRKEHEKRFSIVVVAEGSKMKKEKGDKKDKDKGKKKNRKNSDQLFFPHKIPESELLANKIEKKIGLETRVTSLGYLQRGGIPTPADRILATHLGTRAGEALLNGEFGVMAAYTNGRYVLVPLKEIAGRKKTVTMDDPLIKTAKCLGICLGN